MNLEKYRLTDGIVIDLVTEYQFSAEQNRHILGRKIANAQLEAVEPAIEEALKAQAEEIKRELEGLEVWKDYGWTIEGDVLESFWNKYLTGEV